MDIVGALFVAWKCKTTGMMTANAIADSSADSRAIFTRAVICVSGLVLLHGERGHGEYSGRWYRESDKDLSTRPMKKRETVLFAWSQRVNDHFTRAVFFVFADRSHFHAGDENNNCFRSNAHVKYDCWKLRCVSFAPTFYQRRVLQTVVSIVNSPFLSDEWKSFTEFSEKESHELGKYGVGREWVILHCFTAGDFLVCERPVPVHFHRVFVRSMTIHILTIALQLAISSGIEWEYTALVGILHD